MCLIAKTDKLKTATEDIHCFKRIEFIGRWSSIAFHTPFVYRSVPIDALIGNKDFVAVGDFSPIKENDGKYYIAEGVIHSYLIEAEAKNHSYSDEIVVECVIPKGTEYIEGFDNWGCPCVASKKVRFVSFKTKWELRKMVIKAKTCSR